MKTSVREIIRPLEKEILFLQHSRTNQLTEKTCPAMALLPGSQAPDFTLNSVLDGQVEEVSILINFI